MAGEVIHRKRLISEKAERFTESVIREMTRQAMLYGAINLSQGFPDFAAPEEVKRAAQDAIAADLNQYAITWGAKPLRDAIARQMKLWQGLDVDPEAEITVCCGATEAMVAALLAVCNSGDEIVIFEPFYENYGPDAILAGAHPRFVKLHPPAPGLRRAGPSEPPTASRAPKASPECSGAGIRGEGSAFDVSGEWRFEPDERSLSRARPRDAAGQRPATAAEDEWHFDPDELRRAFNSHTKAILLNTPNNPTGKVFTRPELEFIRNLCVEFNALAITDEIYEHILYDGARHISIATLEGMRDRTITINGMSKTYSVTGWRVGWAVAAAHLSAAIRKVHDFLTVGAPAPLQEAGTVALVLPESYYQKLAADYRARRDSLLAGLRAAGFRAFVPRGAYYIMTDISAFLPQCGTDDVAFTQYLVKEIGVAVVPGSSFYDNPPADQRAPLGGGLRAGAHQVRFAFCKQLATLEEAGRRLAKLARP
ncbi:MAG: pyridoxal phosphate-dependent aminotransferase [Terriglobia bacterium]